jgi:hypothetical protein
MLVQYLLVPYRDLRSNTSSSSSSSSIGPTFFKKSQISQGHLKREREPQKGSGEEKSSRIATSEKSSRTGSVKCDLVITKSAEERCTSPDQGVQWRPE